MPGIYLHESLESIQVLTESFLEQWGLKETIATSFMNNHLHCDRVNSLKPGEECRHVTEFGSRGVMKISQPATHSKEWEAKNDLLII